MLNACTQEHDAGDAGSLLTPIPSKVSPPPRAFSEMVYDSERNIMILFGGWRDLSSNNINSYLNDTWEYSLGTWRKIDTTNIPLGRYGHGLAYDFKQHKVVMHGGITSETTRDINTWEYDGVDWIEQINQSDSPGGREFPIMLFSPLHNATLLLGGDVVDEVWLYNYGTWALMTDTVRLPDRYSTLAKVVYDGNKDVLFMHTSRDIGYGDTFEWRGNTWLSVASRANEAELVSFGLIYDSRREVIVLFGGQHCLRQPSEEQCSEHPQDLTWEYNGDNWQLERPHKSPPARYGHAMAYDESRGVTVLFGGMGENGTTLNDTWEYDGVTWTQR